MLSICMITYNHVNYIAQAIEGVVKQKTNFPIQLIVADDCSSDGTSSIIEEYTHKYPEITFLSRQKNIGMMSNLLDALSHCTGEYIAFCEGDDFWIDPYKVQKQVNFLNEHPEYAICAHNLTTIRADGKPLNELVFLERQEMQYDLRDLASTNMLATASCVYRNNFTFGQHPAGFPDWLLLVKVGDYCLHMLAAKHGKIKYFPEAMGAYRIHDGGVWTGENSFNKELIYFNALDLLRTEFDGEISQLLMRQQIHCLITLNALDGYRFTQHVIEHKNQSSDFFAAEYPFAIIDLLHRGRSLKLSEPNTINKIFFKIKRALSASFKIQR